MVELESLAIKWAMKKCHMYLCGLPEFEVITDHASLPTIFNKYSLSQIENQRVLRYRMALQGYQFKVSWRKGAEHSIPDALSRAPVNDPDEDDESGYK